MTTFLISSFAFMSIAAFTYAGMLFLTYYWVERLPVILALFSHFLLLGVLFFMHAVMIAPGLALDLARRTNDLAYIYLIIVMVSLMVISLVMLVYHQGKRILDERKGFVNPFPF